MAERRRYIYRVTALDYIVDGDTWDLTIREPVPHDFGFNVKIPTEATIRFRLYAIDILEDNQAGGIAAERRAAEWIRVAIADDVLEGESFRKDTRVPDASFGRWLIDLWRIDTGENLRDVLRAEGYEKPPRP